MIHQFCRVGESAMIGGGARISRDVAPFCLAAERNALIGLNIVGIRRRGVARGAVREIKQAFRALNTPVGNLRELAASALLSGDFKSAEARGFLEFFRTGGGRGFARPRRGLEPDE